MRPLLRGRAEKLHLQLPVTLYRGMLGEDLRVPLQPQQYERAALPFFPTDNHQLLVEEMYG